MEPIKDKPTFTIIRGGLPDRWRDPDVEYGEYMAKYLYNTPLNKFSIYPRVTPWKEIKGKNIVVDKIFAEGRDSLQLLLNNSKIPVFCDGIYFGHITMMERISFNKDPESSILLPEPCLKTYTLFSETENEAFKTDIMALTDFMRSAAMTTEYSLLYDRIVCNLRIEQPEEEHNESTD